MSGHARSAFAGILMVGLIAAPSLSSATDRDGKGHSLIQHPSKHAVEHHQPQHYQVGLHHLVEALQLEVAKLKDQVKTLNDRLNGGAGSTTPPPPAPPANPVLTELAKYVKVEPGELNGVKGPHVVFTGVNLHVRSGLNATNDGGALSGLGNLIVGYNETQPTPVVYDGAGCDRTLTGSHNLVLGNGNLFTSYGGLVVGSNHCITSPNTSILAGDTNEGHGPNSAILGGTRRGTSTADQTVPVIR